MYCHRRVKAFTLFELLIVLAIVGGAMLFTTNFTARIRETFVAQQYVKTILQQSRTARRKSMLITRNSNDTGWVHGIGMQLKKNQNGWQLSLIKALGNESQNIFYRSYPTEVSQLRFEEVDAAFRQYLPEGVQLSISAQNVTGSLQARCLRDGTEFLLLFESINGKLHAYCYSQATAGSYVDITADEAASGEGSQNKQIEISLIYPNQGKHQSRVLISQNGDISVQNDNIVKEEEPVDEEEGEEGGENEGE